MRCVAFTSTLLLLAGLSLNCSDPATPQLTQSLPKSVDVGRIQRGDCFDTVVTLTNTSSERRTLSLLDRSGTLIETPAVTVPLTLNAGERLDIEVQLCPKIKGKFSDELRIVFGVDTLRVAFSGETITFEPLDADYVYETSAFEQNGTPRPDLETMLGANVVATNQKFRDRTGVTIVAEDNGFERDSVFFRLAEDGDLELWMSWEAERLDFGMFVGERWLKLPFATKRTTEFTQEFRKPGEPAPLKLSVTASALNDRTFSVAGETIVATGVRVSIMTLVNNVSDTPQEIDMYYSPRVGYWLSQERRPQRPNTLRTARQLVRYRH